MKRVTKKQPEKDPVNKTGKKAASPDNTMKGYNEKNPAQPQGSFKPDSRTKDK